MDLSMILPLLLFLWFHYLTRHRLGFCLLVDSMLCVERWGRILLITKFEKVASLIYILCKKQSTVYILHYFLNVSFFAQVVYKNMDA